MTDVVQKYDSATIMAKLEVENCSIGGRNQDRHYYAIKGPLHGSAADLTNAWRSTFGDNAFYLPFGLVVYEEVGKQPILQSRHIFGLEITGLAKHTVENRYEVHRSINREGCADVTGIVVPPSIITGKLHEPPMSYLPFSEDDRIPFVYSMNRQIGRLVYGRATTGIETHFVYVPPEFAHNDGFPDLPLI